MKWRIALALAACAAALAAEPDRSGYSFKTIDYPYLQPGVQMDMQCLYVSDNGIVGVQYQSPPSGACCGGPGFSENVHSAFLRSGTWKVIDVPGASSTASSNPNDSGQIALTYKFADGVWHVAIWDRSRLIPVPTPRGYPGGLSANGLNNLGVIAGTVTDAAGHAHGYFGYGLLHMIADYPGALDTIFTKVADNGVAAGYYDLADGSMHAFRYAAGKFSTIDPPAYSGVAVALSISDSGAITGAYLNDTKGLIGFLFRKGRFTDFQVPDAVLTVPWHVNEDGQVSGIYAGGDGVYHGFVATPAR